MLRNVICPLTVRFVPYSSFDYPTTYYPPILYIPLFTHAASSIGYTHHIRPPPTSILDCTLRLVLSPMYPPTNHTDQLKHFDDHHHQSSTSSNILAVFIDDPNALCGVVVAECFSDQCMIHSYLTLADYFQCISVCAYFIQPHSDHCLSPPPPPSQCLSYRNGYYCNHNPSINSLWNSIQFSSLIIG